MSRRLHSPKICKGWLGYYLSAARAVCGFFLEQELAGPGEDVTCDKCIQILKCEHRWIFLWEGRHGSDKGVQTWKCEHCMLRFEYEYNMPIKKDRLIPKLFDELSNTHQEAIIWKAFEDI